MQYRHITLNWSLEGLSAKKLISDLGSEGFEPLYSKIATEFSSFLCQKDAFEEYKKIKTRISKEEEKEMAELRDVLRKQLMSSPDFTDYELQQKYAKFNGEQPSFGDLFKNRKYPKVLFSLVDSSSESKNVDSEKSEE